MQEEELKREQDPGVNGPPQHAGRSERAPGESGGEATREATELTSPETPVVSLNDYQEAARERDQFRALAQRVQADFVNYRKRVDAERDEIRRVASRDLLMKLLQVLDYFDLALREDITRDIDQSWVEGVRGVRRSLDAILAGEGIESFGKAGEHFDPRLHEAVARVPTVEAEADMVLKIHHAGYKLRGEVLRPAMVEIAASPPDDAGGARSSEDIEKNQSQSK